MTTMTMITTTIMIMATADPAGQAVRKMAIWPLPFPAPKPYVVGKSRQIRRSFPDRL
jgi:hypothetical protein